MTATCEFASYFLGFFATWWASARTLSTFPREAGWVRFSSITPAVSAAARDGGEHRAGAESAVLRALGGAGRRRRSGVSAAGQRRLRRPITQQIARSGTGNFFALTREPIDVHGDGIARQLLRGEDGAFVNFEGVTRNNTKGRATRYLEYECYEPWRSRSWPRSGARSRAGFAIGRIAMVHRLGRIEIGETSVAVVVTAPHRKPRSTRRSKASTA